MFDDSQGFLTRAFLLREWALDYKAWQGSEEEARLVARLNAWSARSDLRERSAQSAFIQTFFVETWGYRESGRGAEQGFTAWPEYPVEAAGGGGATGAADLALGWFGEGAPPTPQALCEFKDIRSDLDAPQRRKGNTRSPVKQCLDYVAGARRGLFGNEPILPWWGLVTDMNEFRLYWWDRAPKSYLRFLIRSDKPLFESQLTDDTEEASFDRFVFARLFSSERLLSRGGPPSLLRLVQRQGAREKVLEGEFYADYRAVRERLFDLLQVNNPAFPGSPGQLLRLAQKILDRFIFAFYCEDMGERMLFPPQFIADLLRQRSREPLYDHDGDELWTALKRLFQVMDLGGRLGQTELRAFNGGLFRPDAEVDRLSIPNAFFCFAGQGVNAASIEAHRNTLLHLCASYNFAARGNARESISLYTLGRIFEQSITELEIQEARLEGRLSLAEAAKRKLPKRKRDGVYYTPEWVVDQIVDQTLGAWFTDQKAAVGWTEEAPPSLEQLAAYETKVEEVRIVDPACGSGAFLIGAFRRLLAEREGIHGFRRLLQPQTPIRFDEAVATAAILDSNLHGVDINPAAVEIAKLALWLHSARADAPLSSLDGAIACGNSLVGPDYHAWTQIAAFTPAEREQVNAFDWQATFPKVFDGGGFDVVVGNPPYVKLQNLRKVDPDVADYLLAAREERFYASTQTGNFDLYLPFIEKGLDLLRDGGRMGYIAPSIWTVAEYGEGLRQLVRQRRHLFRWIDFKSHQVFQEATTYTALQFFTKSPCEAIQVGQAPKGEADLANMDWSDPDRMLPYTLLPGTGPWLMVTGEERALIDRLADTCQRLDDPTLTEGIIVGIQTSADSIYHLRRLGNGRYWCKPEHTSPYEVSIEDAIMRPLISGSEAKRYEEPRTDTWLLFPYEPDSAGRVRLIEEASMESRFPQAWAYLRSWETLLRQRESGKMDRPDWWSYVYPKNLGKQDRSKLIVPRIVLHLKSYFDRSGTYYLDNVDVGGVLATRNGTAAFLNGALNGSVADFVFRRLSKPFANDYRSANKQFIAPLPVPKADVSQQSQVAWIAKRLHGLWTNRRDSLRAADDRLAALSRARHDARWLWPRLEDRDTLLAAAPFRLKNPKDRRAYADGRLSEAVDTHIAALQAHIDRGGPMEAMFVDGELRLLAGGAVAIDGIYLDDADGAVTAAYWRWLLITGHAMEAGKFAEELRRPPRDGSVPAALQFIAKVTELERVTQAIADQETTMNTLLFDLYGLTADERLLVQRG